MTHRLKIVVATVIPLAAGAVSWLICASLGLDGDTTGIVVGLVVLLPGTPLAIWAGQPAEDAPAESGRSSPAVPLVIGDLPREPKAFQQRSALQQQLAGIFSPDGVAVVCALVGPRGVGKSHLAAAYARNCAGEGIGVAWLNAETAGQLSSSIELMVTELELQVTDAAALVRKVRRWLEDRTDPYLLVIDNATDPDALATLLPSRGPARILITTNDLAFERIASVVPVDRYSAGEGLSYLAERVGPAVDDHAAELVAELERLPLALSIATAALIGPPRISYADYLRRVRDTPVDVLLARPRGQTYPRGVAESILLALSDAGMPAAVLLDQLAVLSASGVELSLIEDDRAALSELATRSLVTFTEDGSVVLVHRLVRRVIQDKATRDGNLLAAIDGAVGRLQAVEHIPEADTWRRLSTMMSMSEHAVDLWGSVRRLVDEQVPQVQPVAEAVLAIRLRVINHYLYLNDGLRAVPIAESAVDGWVQLKGEDHPTTLSAMGRLAQAYEQAGQADRAIALYRDVVARQTERLGASAPDTLRSRTGLALALTEAARAGEAVELLDQVVAEQAVALPEHDPDRRSTRFTQAYAHVHAGQAELGVQLFQSLATDQAQAIGADHADTLVTKGRLAWALVAAGEPERGLAEYEAVLEAQRRIIGDDHPDTLITEHGVAATYERLGRLADAAAHFESVATRYESALGPAQPLVETARQDLARVRALLSRQE